MTAPAPGAIANRLLPWFAAHGRHNLPWQQDPTPYRVWVSEVMLQQTQVATVIPYYLNFMSSYPSVAALGAAPLDEVLHHWTGLGYYARARNLHTAARTVAEKHGGCVPEEFDALGALPGIGRSTAGAILALSRSQRHPILDGNARRVLARFFGVEGHMGQPSVVQRLWALADACTPSDRVSEYTQAIMDLGSTVCTRTRPACGVCPLRESCVARESGRQQVLPSPKPRKARRHREAVALMVVSSDGAVLLEDRPPSGLWGGLASVPMFDSVAEALAWYDQHFEPGGGRERLPAYAHAFTHFDLTLHPVLVRCNATRRDIGGHRWYDPKRPARVGLSKPAVDLVRAVTGSGVPESSKPAETPQP